MDAHKFQPITALLIKRNINLQRNLASNNRTFLPIVDYRKFQKKFGKQLLPIGVLNQYLLDPQYLSKLNKDRTEQKIETQKDDTNIFGLPSCLFSL